VTEAWQTNGFEHVSRGFDESSRILNVCLTISGTWHLIRCGRLAADMTLNPLLRILMSL